MKAITLWQPWASLVAIGAKRFETRSWATTYRGPLAIHAAKKPMSSILPMIATLERKVMELSFVFSPGVFHGFDSLPLGCIVATCELADCLPVEDVYHELYDMRNEEHFGDFSAGRFAWRLNGVVLLDKPIPARGAQRLWEWEKPA